MKLRALPVLSSFYLITTKAGEELYRGHSYFVACLVCTVMDGEIN